MLGLYRAEDATELNGLLRTLPLYEWMNVSVTNRLLSLAEAAEMLGVGRSTVYKLAKQGALPVPLLEIGPVLRVSLVHVERYPETGLPVRPWGEYPLTVRSAAGFGWAAGPG